MAQGEMIQLGATPTSAGETRDGYGEFVTVQRLEELERQRVRDHLKNVRPELLAESVKAWQVKSEADANVERLRRELHLTVGGDGMRAALAMIAEEAAKQAKVAEMAKAEAVKTAEASKQPAKK